MEKKCYEINDLKERCEKSGESSDNFRAKGGMMPKLSCFWQRACAAYIDAVIFYFIYLVLLKLNLGILSELTSSLAIFVASSFMLSSSLMTTPGGYIVGIRVVSEEFLVLTKWQAVKRQFIAYFSLLFFGLGYVLAIFHPKNQTFHDIVAKTFVFTQSPRRNIWYFLVFIMISVISETVFSSLGSTVVDLAPERTYKS